MISRNSSCIQFLSSSKMRMREFFPENFPERVVILQNCPKGCYVTSHPSVEGCEGR